MGINMETLVKLVGEEKAIELIGHYKEGTEEERALRVVKRINGWVSPVKDGANNGKSKD